MFRLLEDCATRVLEMKFSNVLCWVPRKDVLEGLMRPISLADFRLQITLRFGRFCVLRQKFDQPFQYWNPFWLKILWAHSASSLMSSFRKSADWASLVYSWRKVLPRLEGMWCIWRIPGTTYFDMSSCNKDSSSCRRRWRQWRRNPGTPCC